MDIDELFNEGRKLHQAGRIGEAIIRYRKVLQQEPRHPHIRYLLGVSSLQMGQHEQARRYLSEMLRMRPAHAPSWRSLGHAEQNLGGKEAAMEAYQRSLTLEADNAEAAVALAELWEQNREFEKVDSFCRESYAQISAGATDLLAVWIRALNGLRKQEESARLCVRHLNQRRLSEEERELVLNWMWQFFSKVQHPGRELIRQLWQLPDVRGKALYLQACARGKHQTGFGAGYEQFRNLDPDGQIMSDEQLIDLLLAQKLYKEAERLSWKLLLQDPEKEDSLRRLVDALLGLAKKDQPEKYVEARELADQFLHRHPESLQANATMANVLLAASRPELALPYQEKVLELKPDHGFRGSILFTMNYDERRSPDEVYGRHESWGEWFERDKKPMLAEFANTLDSKRKLRIGYLSPDLGYHPVGYFFINILKAHSPDHVEVFLFSNRDEEDGDDALSQEFREHVGTDHWMWTRSLPAGDLVRAIKDRGIDILVEMAGHTAHNRLDVLAHRAAPVQVSWLGYPNTTGLTTVDYRFSDSITEPEGEADRRSTESIWRLPNGFHSIRMPADAPPVDPPPCLKNGYITFGTYNNMNKLGSESIALWSDLLKRVPRSRIIIKHSTLRVLNNRQALLSRFAMHGIQAWRVDLRETTPGTAAHLRTYGDIDIALDPLAYNGTTTSCDALFMGVPILTLPGRTHASRVTASLLHRLGMDGWIARDREDFLETGSLVAQNPVMLEELRKNQRRRFLESPLGNGSILAADLEDAYREMWERYCSHGEEGIVL